MIRILLALLLLPGLAQAAEVRVLTAGAYRQALVALAPAFEAETKHHLVVQNETTGGVALRVRAGEPVDLLIMPPAPLQALGALVGPTTPLARVGIGVAVRAGAKHPDIGTVEAFRAAVLAARAPAWIDPAAGGSSGIYIASLFERWGIAAELRPRAVLVQGGLVADAVVSGQADLAIQQMSELAVVPGVELVGPLPAEIQNYTVYAGAVRANAAQAEAAKALLAYLASPAAASVLRAKGMLAP